jgi:phosphoglycolate phosphatase
LALTSVIFDLDGTLLDTLADLAEAVNRTLAANSLPDLPTAGFRQMVGSGARHLVCQAYIAAGAADPSESELDNLMDTYRTAYAACWQEQTSPYPGILPMLSALRSAGLHLAVLSNKPDPFTRQMVGHYFPAGLFDVVVGQLDGWPLKPDPALALDICRRLGQPPASTALVGDSGSDMLTAARGGMLPLGVLWGFRSAEEILRSGAAQVFSDAACLGQYLVERKAGG